MRDEAEDTIDGVDRANSDGRPATTVVPPVVDYPELTTIERHHYVIRGEIAKGGMGRVLEARDLRLGRAVAIKELLPKNRDAARRFEREARITARLQHPAIINVYEAGVWPGGEPFYAMTKVTGRSLAQVVAERKTLEERIGLLPNVIAVADALAYAHSQDVVHRDLKPANVLVGGFGETVVIDWGLAKDLAAPQDPALSLEMKRPAEETLTGSVVGTPAYMPPEQARGEPVDQRADVYALGALLYKVLSGAPPYTAKSSNEVVQQVLDGPPVPVDEREPGAPPDLVAIVEKAMARDPAARYPTAAELAADLKRFETGQLVAAHHYTRWQLVGRWLHRHRVAVAITSFAIVMFAVFGTLSVRRIISEKDRAETEQRKDERRRAALLEERGRAELLAGRAGKALVNLAGAVRGKPGGALGFMLAEAMRPFEAEVATVRAGGGTILVAYRPDGTEFATASADGVVARWDAVGKRVRELDRGHGGVRALVWSRDSTMLAAGGEDKVVRVWTADGATITLAGHEGAIGDISFSHDGKRLVSASADGTARMWDLETRNSGVIAQYETAVTVAQFSPEGMRVVTGSKAGDLDVWSPDLASRSPLPAHTNPVLAAGDLDAWSPDRSTRSPLRAHTDAILSARWTQDGDRLVTTSADGTARLWNPTSGKLVASPIRHKGDVPIDDAAWSHDGHRLITAGSDRVARVWLVPPLPADGELPGFARELAELPHADRVTRVRFTVDERWIITAGNDRSARVWDAKGQLMATFEHAEAVATVEVSRDGTTVVTGCRDGTAHVWDLTRGSSRYSRDLLSAVQALAVSRDGRVAGGAFDSRVWVWQPDGLAQTLKAHVGSVLAVAFSDDGRALATAGEDAEVFVWTVGVFDKPRLALPVGAVPVLAVAFGPAGEIIAGDSAGVLRIWTPEGRLAATATVSAGVAIKSIAVDPRTGAIATASSRGVELWNLQGKQVLHQATPADAHAVAFDRRGEHLAIAGAYDTVVARFTGDKLVPVVTLEGPTGAVGAVAFAADGSLVFTGGADGIARVWDATKGKLLATRDTGGEAIQALAVSDSELLWTGNTDGIARAHDVRVLRDTSGLKDFIERRVPWRLGDDDVVRRAD